MTAYAGSMITKVCSITNEIDYPFIYINLKSIAKTASYLVIVYFQYYSFKLVNYTFDTTLKFNWIYNNIDWNNKTMFEADDFMNFNKTQGIIASNFSSLIG